MDIPPPRPYSAAWRGPSIASGGIISDIDDAAAAQSGDILTERRAAFRRYWMRRNPSAIDDDKRSGNCDFTRPDWFNALSGACVIDLGTMRYQNNLNSDILEILVTLVFLDARYETEKEVVMGEKEPRENELFHSKK